MEQGFAMSGTRRRGGMRWWVLVLFAGYLGYYWLSHRHETPFTGRTQIVDATMDQEVALGLQGFREILGEAKLVREGEALNLVQEVARRLIAVGPKLEQHLARARGVEADTPWQKFDWEVAVIDSDQANAFCLPGGKMAVYTGILPVTQNEDALAVVMGHEIAHALQHHGAERMAQQKLVQVGSLAAGMSTSDMDPRQRQLLMAAVGVGTQYGLTLPFSRSHEAEADQVGLMLAAAACFDPQAAIGLWQRMGEHAKGAPPEFMSTHPSSSSRIERLQGWMDEANTIRAQFCGEQP